MKEFDISTEARRLESLAPKLLIVSLVAAVVGLGGSAAMTLQTEGGVDRFLGSYLISFAYFLSLSLGALFFVLLQHVTRAGWSVTVRRIAEGLAANVVVLALLVVPIVYGMGHLYHWSHPGVADHDAILAGKVGFLNPTFFTIRIVLYFTIWIALSWFMFRTSTKQDESRDPQATLRMERFGAPGMILFALSANFAAFDLLMSLDPHWFSTIFGVYYFASSVVIFFAMMAMILVALQSSGRLTRVVTIEHYHDIGKFLFAFVVFWAYIAFSQYMLIWYGNLPEETGWFLKRQTEAWVPVSLALLFGHFVLPFFALISRHVKRRPRLLAVGALWMAAMHYLDLYWLAMPELSTDPVFGLVDILIFLGIGGVFVAGFTLRMRRHSLIPDGDPRLNESIAFENA